MKKLLYILLFISVNCHAQGVKFINGSAYNNFVTTGTWGIISTTGDTTVRINPATGVVSFYAGATSTIKPPSGMINSQTSGFNNVTQMTCFGGGRSNIKLSFMARGTPTSPTALISGDIPDNSVVQVYDGTSVQNAQQEFLKAADNFTAGYYPVIKSFRWSAYNSIALDRITFNGLNYNISTHAQTLDTGAFKVGDDPANIGLGRLQVLNNTNSNKPAVYFDNANYTGDVAVFISAGSKMSFVNKAVTTTDATPTTIGTISIPNNSRIRIEVSIKGTSLPNDVYGIKSVLARNNSGTVTLLGSVSDIVTTQSDVSLIGASFTIVPSGTDILVQVTGIAATTIDWKANIKYIAD